MRDPSRVRVTGPLEPFAAGFIAELAGGRVSAGCGGGAGSGACASEPLDAGAGRSAGELREPELERFRREHLARVASVRGARDGAAAWVSARLGVVPAQSGRRADGRPSGCLSVSAVSDGRARIDRGDRARLCRHRAPVRGVARERGRRGRSCGSCRQRTCSGSCWRKPGADRGSRRSCWSVRCGRCLGSGTSRG